MDIQGKLVLISGAASGIGKETAYYFASLGAKLALIDSNPALAKIAKELKADFSICNVSDADAVARAIEIFSSKKAISVCINCAGIAPAKRIVGKEGPMPLAEFNKVIEVNLIGSFNILRLVAEKMSKSEIVSADNERGVIINTASIAAFEGQIGQAAYAASKGAIVSLTLPAARELARFGIRVMTIAPGLVETPLLSGLPQEVQTNLQKDIPFPKRFASPLEFARLAAHIVENSMLNGEVIRLDGALRMPA